MPEQEEKVEEKTEEEKTEEKVEKTEWDKERQRANQEHANFEKASAKSEVLGEQVAVAQEQIEQLQAKLTTQEKQAEDKGLDIEELDPNTSDIPDVVRQNKALIKELQTNRDELAKLKGLAQQFQQERAIQQADSQKKQTIEKILKPLDERFAEGSPKFRAQAKKLADKMVQSGDADQPQDALEARDLMEKVYRELADKQAKDKEPVPKTDTGVGGINWQEIALKEGSQEDVLADMRKKGWAGKKK